jgi:ABC-2 type transport system permease protein
MLRNIWKVRELLFVLVRRDLIVRYQSSVLGFFWSFAKPLALVVIFFVAFGLIFNVPRPNPSVPFALHLLVGIMVWSFLARCVTEGHWAILSHANLIKKIRLPVEVFPAVTVAGNLINFLLGMLVVYPVILVAMARAQGFSSAQIAQIPVQLALLVLLTLLAAMLAFSLALIAAAVNVFYRDAESLSEVLLQAWFYATPIVYPVSLFYEKGIFGGDKWPRWLEALYWLNPMTPICVAFRNVLLYRAAPSPGAVSQSAAPLLANATAAAKPIFNGLEAANGTLMLYLGISLATTIVLYAVAQAIFRHYARSFADEI